MELTDAYKRKLNSLIVFYRKENLRETNDGRWQQQYFYKNEDNKAICSSATYCRLEKNKVYAEDSVYYFVAKKLGKEIRIMPEIDQYLNGVIDHLYAVLEQVYEAQAVELLDHVLPYVGRLKNILYYEEYIWLFEMMHDYLSNVENLMSEYQFNKICTLMNIFPSKFQELLKRFIYLYANMKEDEYLEKILNLFNYGDSDFVPNQIACIHIHKRSESRLKALQLCLELLKLLDHEDNKNLLLIVYTHTFTLLSGFDKTASLQYMKKAEELIEGHDFYINRKSMFYMNAGSTCLALGRYEDSILYHKKAMELTKQKQMRAYICICHCYQVSSGVIPSAYLTLSEDEGDRVEWLLYDFYRQYDTNSLADNITYIMNKLVRVLTKHDELFVRIVKDELYILCHNVNRFKSYVTFLKMFEQA